MNRSISSNDLSRLSEKAWSLAKLTKSTLNVSSDLTAGKSDRKNVQDAIKRCLIRLRRKNVNKKQRRQIEQKLDFYNEWLHHNSIELKENQSTFSEAISQIESVLGDLAEMHEDLANVHRFEHA
jgi:hypothetical protein